MEAQSKCNGKFFLSPRRVSAALAGFRFVSNNLISKNSKYFGYGTGFILYFFKIPSIELVETFSVTNIDFLAMRLSPTNFEDAFIIVRNQSPSIINIKTKFVKITFHEIDGVVECVEYTPDGKQVVVSFKNSTAFNIFDVESGLKKTVNFFTTLRCRRIAFIPNTDKSMLYFSDENIHLIDVETKKVTKFGIKSVPHDVKFDPLNNSNVLLITNLKKWAYITIFPTSEVISFTDREDMNFSCGDWIESMPGHVITCDKDKGIVYVWAVASGSMVFSQTLVDSPIASMDAISRTEFIITFLNGVMGIYNPQSREFKTIVERSHTSTIFQGEFVPSDPSTLVTAGSNGSICFWALPNLTQRSNFSIFEKNANFLTISVSAGGGYIAAGAESGEVYIYKTDNCALVFKKKLHSRPVRSVKWCPHNNNILATAGDDNSCFFYDVNKMAADVKIIVKMPFRRVQWSPHDTSIAIACSDGSIYIRSDGGTYSIIEASKYPLYDIAWSPTRPNILATIDDNGNMIVVNLENKNVISTQGHYMNGRALVFSQSVPDLVITGGYDGYLIFWDVMKQERIAMIAAHSSHIYGIAMSPEYPTLFATVSRDFTTRLFSTDRMFPDKKITAMLSGEKFFSFKFSPFPGAQQLEKILHRVMKDGTKVAFGKNDIIHVRDITRLARMIANKNLNSLPRLENAKKSKSTQEQIKKIASDLIIAGNIKKYCELMFLAGEFDLALAAAPAVSYQFWHSLLTSRAAMLDGDDASDLLVAAGKPTEAIDVLLKEELYNAAFLVAVAELSSYLKPRTVCSPKTSKEFKWPFIVQDFNEIDFNLYEIASKRATKLAKNGDVLLSAAVHLSIGDVPSAVWRLVNAGELAIAYDISQITGVYVNGLLEKVFMFCSKNRRGGDAMKIMDKKKRRELAYAMNYIDMDHRVMYYSEIGISSPAEFLAQSKSTGARGAKQVQYLFLAGHKEEAIDAALDFFKKNLFGKDSFDFKAIDDVAAILRIASPTIDVRTEKGMVVVTLCHFVGIYKAFWKGFTPILHILQDAFLDAARSSGSYTEILLSLNPQINQLISIAKIKRGENGYETNPPENGGVSICCLQPGVIGVGLEENKRRSLITRKRIRGNNMTLEDHVSVVTLEDALMWFDVTPFSPLRTSAILNPY